MLNLLVIGISLLAGIAARRLFDIPDRAPLVLNQFVIYVSLPAVVLLHMPRLEMGIGVLYPMLSCWVLIAVSAFLILLLSHYYGWSRNVTGALLMVVPLGNTSYLGYPLTRLFLGEEAMPYAILYDQLGNFVALAIYGTFIAGLYGRGGESFSARSTVLRIFGFPPFLALLLALVIEPVPSPWSIPLQWLAATLAPLALFIVGLQFRVRIDTAHRLPVGIGLGIKMILAPLLMLVMGAVTGQSAIVLQTTVLESGMPPMVTAAVMAMAAGLSPALCASLVGLGVLLAAVTLPVLVFLTGWLQV